MSAGTPHFIIRHLLVPCANQSGQQRAVHHGVAALGASSDRPTAFPEGTADQAGDTA
jgi:hypothetical protein